MKKIYRKRSGSKNTTNHTIYPFMGNGQLLFFKWESIFFYRFCFYSDCNGINKLNLLITKFQRKKGKYVALALAYYLLLTYNLETSYMAQKLKLKMFRKFFTFRDVDQHFSIKVK
jgi:hypothetical protein